jgi:dTDP-4-amino-4,6-dideoxygalactose transaminase
LQPAYQDRLFHVKGGLPHSETAARELLSLPMYPQLNEDQISRTTAAVAGFYTRNKFQAEDGMESVGLSDQPG